MTETLDHRKAAESRVRDLIAILQKAPASTVRDSMLEECESLAIAIDAFHMEGIRFRMFNVDRAMHRADVPPEALTVFADIRQRLEAAGFHTRSHQAPS